MRANNHNQIASCAQRSPKSRGSFPLEYYRRSERVFIVSTHRRGLCRCGPTVVTKDLDRCCVTSASGSARRTSKKKGTGRRRRRRRRRTNKQEHDEQRGPETNVRGRCFFFVSGCAHACDSLRVSDRPCATAADGRLLCVSRCASRAP